MASTLQHNTYKEHATSNKKNVVDIEEYDEDLFEIDLEAVDNFPPPYYWGSHSTATANTLFANCLVPIADVSSAIPMAKPKEVKKPWVKSGPGNVIWVSGAEPFENIARVPISGALGNLLQKTLSVSSSFDQGK